MIENYDPTELYQGKRVYYPIVPNTEPGVLVNSIEEVVTDIHEDAQKTLPVGTEYIVLFIPARIRGRGAAIAEGYVYWSSGATPHQRVTDIVDEFTDMYIYDRHTTTPIYQLRQTFRVENI